jgi:hypothetical protein
VCVELVLPEFEGLVEAGLGFVLLLLFPDPFPLLTVFALGGEWYRKGTDAAMRLDAMMATTPMSRLLAGRFIGLLFLPFLFLPSMTLQGILSKTLDTWERSIFEQDACSIVIVRVKVFDSS